MPGCRGPGRRMRFTRPVQYCRAVKNEALLTHPTTWTPLGRAGRGALGALCSACACGKLRGCRRWWLAAEQRLPGRGLGTRRAQAQFCSGPRWWPHSCTRPRPSELAAPCPGFLKASQTAAKSMAGTGRSLRNPEAVLSPKGDGAQDAAGTGLARGPMRLGSEKRGTGAAPPPRAWPAPPHTFPSAGSGTWGRTNRPVSGGAPGASAVDAARGGEDGDRTRPRSPRPPSARAPPATAWPGRSLCTRAPDRPLSGAPARNVGRRRWRPELL